MKGLSQHTYGIVYTSNYKDESWDVTGGLNLQQFRGSHFGYLTYIKNEEADASCIARVARTISTMTPRLISMTTAASFKAKYNFADYWNVFMDLQIRHVEYMTDGQNDRFYKVANGYKNQLLDISERYDFVNPRQV